MHIFDMCISEICTKIENGKKASQQELLDKCSGPFKINKIKCEHNYFSTKKLI